MNTNDDQVATNPVKTWDVLLRCGFVLDESNGGLELCFDFGCLRLFAGETYTLRIIGTVLFSGMLWEDREFAFVEFEIPSEIESYEQGIAFLAYFLDSYELFAKRIAPNWIVEGRKHFRLLPWERERLQQRREHAAYHARPKCAVQREWMRVALKSLAKFLAQSNEASRVTITFDGSILKLDCDGQIIVTAAQGDKWPCSYSIPAAAIKQLPRRLANEVAIVSIWDNRLTIASRCYGGVVAGNEANHSMGEGEQPCDTISPSS